MKKNLLKMSALLVLMTFVMSFASAQKNAPTSFGPTVSSITQTHPSYVPENSGKATILGESFDGATFPPTGWTAVAGSGTYNWEQVTSGTHPDCTPHSGAAMIKYNCWSASTGDWAVLTSPVVNLTGNTGAFTVGLWMCHSTVYTGDHVEIYVNTTASLTGATLVGDVLNNDGTTIWSESTFPIPATFNTATNYVLFKAISAYGDGMYVDDISVVSPEAHDFGVTAITPTFVNAGSTVTPVVTIKNFGTNNEATWSVTLTDGGSYTSTKANISTINAGATLDVSMDDWTPSAGNYTLTATVTLTGDTYPANNEMAVGCNVMNTVDAFAADWNGGSSVNTNGILHVPTDIFTTIGTSDMIRGMAFDNSPTVKKLYGLTYLGDFGTIDTLTGVFTLIGSTGQSPTFWTTLAFDPETSEMFAFGLTGSYPLFTIPIYSIDIATGAATLVANSSHAGCVAVFAFGRHGNLYGVDHQQTGNGMFYKVNKTTAEMTLVGDMGTVMSANFQGMSYDFDNEKLYLQASGAGAMQGSYSIDTLTGIPTLEGTPYPGQIMGFAFHNYRPVGISKDNVNSTVNIYPNPSTGLYTVNVKSLYNVNVYDITGKLVSTSTVNTANNTIDLTSQPSGMYFIKLVGANTINLKVVKK
jgi:hypothetical protein